MLRHLKKRHAANGGQVLIVAVMLILILVILGIFLYDLQYMVRLRNRTQTSADAAVMSAAAWQGRTLNLIGELNLIKAATILISDIPPYGDASEAGLLEAAALISEMQTRASYAGPLLGLAAAQEAAKHNGMRPVPLYTDRVRNHVDDYLASGVYADAYPAPFNGYDWPEPYTSMLNQIIYNGIAAYPVNSRYLMGMPTLIGDGADLLLDRGFYPAVHANLFCWFYLRGIGPYDEYDFSGIEYDENTQSYFVGSEFLPLYIDFSAALDPTSDMGPYHSSRGMTALADNQPGKDEIEWAVYDTEDSGGWSETSLYDFVNPYLRSNVKTEFTYSGAAARMICMAQPSIISGVWTWEYGDVPAGEIPESLGDELSWSDYNIGDPGGSFAEQGQRLRQAEQQLEGLRATETVNSSAAAKPFGALAPGTPPHAAGIILPVFTDVRLIPSALVKYNALERDPAFFRFIVEYFGDPDYPDVPQEIRNRYIYYISAIEKFKNMNSSFRSAWYDYDDWRNDYMDGDDDIPDTDDDLRDPCLPPEDDGGGGGGGGGGGDDDPSVGGPDPLH